MQTEEQLTGRHFGIRCIRPPALHAADVSLNQASTPSVFGVVYEHVVRNAYKETDIENQLKELKYSFPLL